MNENPEEIIGEVKSDKKNKPEAMQVTKRMKIGRNDKCPCNSGKKYKKCCLV